MLTPRSDGFVFNTSTYITCCIEEFCAPHIHADSRLPGIGGNTLMPSTAAWSISTYTPCCMYHSHTLHSCEFHEVKPCSFCIIGWL